jgi:hypothetical protein
LVDLEIARVKGLTIEQRVTQKWATIVNREKGTVWENDPLSWLPDIGKKTQEKLNKSGIMTIMQLSCLDDDNCVQLASECRYNQKRVMAWRDRCQDSYQGICPFPKGKDFVHEQINPYLAKYGSEWKNKIKTVTQSGLTSVVCVTDLIEHIEVHTKEVYKNTKYADTYMWSHDALKQMCDKACREWMKSKGYWKRWVKPELGLNDIVELYDEEGTDVKQSKDYAKRPVGDQPELMPHDSSLNWDVEKSNDMHVLFTQHLPNSDPRKFQKDIPSEIVKAILKLYGPVTGVVPKPHYSM